MTSHGFFLSWIILEEAGITGSQRPYPKQRDLSNATQSFAMVPWHKNRTRIEESQSSRE
jgi:hypothetical protein